MEFFQGRLLPGWFQGGYLDPRYQIELRKKKTSYVLHYTGWFIGILISWFIINPMKLDSRNPRHIPKNNQGFFPCSIEESDIALVSILRQLQNPLSFPDNSPVVMSCNRTAMRLTGAENLWLPMRIPHFTTKIHQVREIISKDANSNYVDGTWWNN